MMMPLRRKDVVLGLFQAFLFCNLGGAASSDNVPGCDCSAAGCDSYLAACAFREGPVGFLFEGIENQTGPICDALDASPVFQETVGTSAVATKSYYESGVMPTLIGIGTCEDAYEEQSSCRPQPEGLISFGYKVMRPGDCGVLTIWLLSGSPVDVSSRCHSFVNESISSGWEDSLDVYVEPFARPDSPFLCDGEAASEYTPKLTSKDWIEPQPGRRYMCYDFTDYADNDRAYYVLLTNLGNAPCTGPEPEPEPESEPEPQSTPSPAPAQEGSGNGLIGKIVAIVIAAVVVIGALVVLSKKYFCPGATAGETQALLPSEEAA